jgi:hypothetical protein
MQLKHRVWRLGSFRFSASWALIRFRLLRAIGWLHTSPHVALICICDLSTAKKYSSVLARVCDASGARAQRDIPQNDKRTEN